MTEDIIKEGKLLAAYIGGGVMLLAIGILNVASELSKAIGKALELYKPLGAYSGKITFGLICGGIVWGVLHFVLKDKKADAKAGLIFFIAALLLATLFVFTPFIGLLE